MPKNEPRLKMPAGISQDLKEHGVMKKQAKNETSERPSVQTSERSDVQEPSPPKEKEKRERHTIYLTLEMSDRLRLEAFNTGEEMSRIVEKALQDLLK